MAEKVIERGESPETDNEFEPTADMLVHDYDDEQTLDDEENQSCSDGGDELDDLQKESDMPMEELMKMYGYGDAPNELNESRSSSEAEILSNQDLTLDKDEVARDLLKDEDDDEGEETTERDLLDSVEYPSHTARLLRSEVHEGLEGSDDDDDSADADYQPTQIPDWKKAVSIGPDYQADIPDNSSDALNTSLYENDDRLIWDPSRMAEMRVEEYLHEIQYSPKNKESRASPSATHTSDDEQALYLLMQCDYNAEEALRRHRVGTISPSDPMSLWSEDECQNFENGLKTYGKDFFLIQQNKVRTRSTGELVQFYYLWKKTERHDVFASRNRLEKRKYALNPGTTDYMDRFIDEQENQPIHRDRPSSPTLSLLMADHKRQVENPVKTPTQEEVAAVLELVHNVVDPKTLHELKSLTELVPDLSVSHLDDSSSTVHPASLQGNPLNHMFQSVETLTEDNERNTVQSTDEPPVKRPRTEVGSSCSNCIRSNSEDQNSAPAFGASGSLASSYSENMCHDSHTGIYSSGPLTNESGHSFNIDFASSGTARSVTSGSFAH